MNAQAFCWGLSVGLLLGAALSFAGGRIALIQGRTQIVRFVLLRIESLLGTQAADEVLSWVDELTDNGTNKVFSGHVRHIPNSDPGSREWKS